MIRQHALEVDADRTVQGWVCEEEIPNESGVRGSGGSLIKHGLSAQPDQAGATLLAE